MIFYSTLFKFKIRIYQFLFYLAIEIIKWNSIRCIFLQIRNNNASEGVARESQDNYIRYGKVFILDICECVCIICVVIYLNLSQIFVKIAICSYDLISLLSGEILP